MLHDILIALIAGGCMLVTDVLGSILIQATAKGRGWIAGLMDAIAWIVSISCTSITVSALTGHDLKLKAWVIGVVSAANVIGTKLGTDWGARLMKLRRNGELGKQLELVQVKRKRGSRAR